MFERLEVVPVVLDLGPFDDPESEPQEDVDDLVLDQRQRVQRSRARSPAGQREIHPVGVEQGVLRRLLEHRDAVHRPPRCSCRRDLVHPLADVAAGLRGRVHPSDPLHLRSGALRPRTAICAASSSSSVARRGERREAALAARRRGTRSISWASMGSAESTAWAVPRPTHRESRAWNVSRPAAASPHARPPCASATPSRDEQPDLGPSPGARSTGFEQLVDVERSGRRRATAEHEQPTVAELAPNARSAPRSPTTRAPR